MSSDHEAEIRASVAAHADLGPGYDDAVAEGLVERIGAEIDKRIDARLGQFGRRAPGLCWCAWCSWCAWGWRCALVRRSWWRAGGRWLAGTGGAGVSGIPGAGRTGYQGYQGYMGPMLPPGYQLGPPPVRPSSVGQRNVATTITALGSMALGVAATAIVSHDKHSGGQAFMVLLIWVAIAVINVAYARRP